MQQGERRTNTLHVAPFLKLFFSLSFLFLLSLGNGMPSYMEAETSVREPQRSSVPVLERMRMAKRHGWL